MQYDWYPNGISYKDGLNIIAILPSVKCKSFDVELNKFISLLIISKYSHIYLQFHLYTNTRNNKFIMSHLSRNLVKYVSNDSLYDSFIKIHKPHFSHGDYLGYSLIDTSNCYSLANVNTHLLNSNSCNDLTYKLNKPTVLIISNLRQKGSYYL